MLIYASVNPSLHKNSLVQPIPSSSKSKGSQHLHYDKQIYIKSESRVRVSAFSWMRGHRASSKLPFATRYCTFTTVACPMRWHRSSACSNCAGVQYNSAKTTLCGYRKSNDTNMGHVCFEHSIQVNQTRGYTADCFRGDGQHVLLSVDCRIRTKATTVSTVAKLRCLWHLLLLLPTHLNTAVS